MLVKKMTIETFEQITKPLKEAAKKVGFHENEVEGLVHKLRKK